MELTKDIISRVIKDNADLLAELSRAYVCPHCKSIRKESCSECKGKGYLLMPKEE